MLLRSRAEIIHTLCLSESAIAALSSVNVPPHASLLLLALTNSSFAFCMNNFCTAPYRHRDFDHTHPDALSAIGSHPGDRVTNTV